MINLENLKTQLTDAEEFNSKLGKYLDEAFKIVDDEGNYLSIRDWKKYFNVKIPENINFPILIELAIEISKKYQEAAYYRDKQNVQLAILERVRGDKYYLAYQNARESTRRESGKALAAESCKVEAILATKELEEAMNSQKIICDFWDRTCKTLTDIRKLIEIIGFALSGDAKTQRDFIVRNN